MQLEVEPGIYVVAVSGGVDSVALLDLLRQESGLKLTVAHFDHGIRPDSAQDRRLVQALAAGYGLPFVYGEAQLGAGASEAAARAARYEFLNRVKQASGAKAIITAHHQDDLIETAILNMLRGTGRKGLTSLQSGEVIRPLLAVSKADLIKYAQTHGLKWREDSTNQDADYLRNHVRHAILTRLDAAQKQELLNTLSKMKATNAEIDELLTAWLGGQNTLERLWFNQLPHSVAKEMLATWLRSNQLRDFDSKTLERLVTAAKTAPAGKRFPVLKGVYMEVGPHVLALA